LSKGIEEMKAKYKILYKNGIEDEVVQEATEEEIKHLNETIYEALQNDVEGVITLGDGKNQGYFIRLSDVSRVMINTNALRSGENESI
jgi:soluble P-type ATPase